MARVGPGGQSLDLHWVTVGGGRLALWHRPGQRHFAALRNAGATHVVTLLSEREGAQAIGAATRAAGLSWVWLPLPNSAAPTGDDRVVIADGLSTLSALLDDGNHLVLHCSAGMHRTGMIAYALLRRRGLDRDEALATIAGSRVHTRRALTDRLLGLGDEVAEELAVEMAQPGENQER